MFFLAKNSFNASLSTNCADNALKVGVYIIKPLIIKGSNTKDFHTGPRSKTRYVLQKSCIKYFKIGIMHNL